MSAFSQKTFTPVPPLKGSFPLDHEGLCRSLMIKYMRCLVENRNESGKCRNVSKNYLECRMENNLMAREEWSKLGFSNEVGRETFHINQSFDTPGISGTKNQFYFFPLKLPPEFQSILVFKDDQSKF